MAFEYWRFLIKKITGQNKSPEAKKFAYKEKSKVKEKPYVKPKPAPKKSGVKLSFDPSVNIASVITQAVAGIIGLFVLATVMPAVMTSLNTSAMGPASSAMIGMINMIPLVLMAAFGAGILFSILRISM